MEVSKLNNNIDYGTAQIKTLEGIEAIRLRAGMFIGSVGPEGVQHITLEIISNVIDEYLNGYCNKCIITVTDDNTVTITDNGRGVPFGKAEDGTETLINVYTKLHTGAKFDSSGKTGYNSSGGMNGVGAKATNALSSNFKVISTRDNKQAIAIFEKGKIISYEEKNWKTSETGTTVIFKPDETVFKETIELDYTKLHNQIKELSFLSPGLAFEFTYKNKPKEIITSQKGIRDYIDELNKNKNTITNVFYAEVNEDRLGVKIAMQYNDSYSDTYKLYTNSIPNSGGTHLTGFRTALTQGINKYARENKILKEKDNNLTGDELKEGLVLILSFIMPDPVFSGQTKDVLSSNEARTIVQRLVSKEIENWLNNNKNDAKAIINKAISARKAREAAKKARDAVRQPKEKKKSFLNLPSKLVDCWGKDRNKCELFIVEGDSASGGLVEGRDAEYVAIFPIRGKIISSYKNSSEKIFANQEVINLIKAIGLDLDPKTNKLIYNINKLRYGKILLAADADPDGASIRNLLIELFWWLCPELIENGHIYTTMPPLFRITTKKNEYIFLKDQNALEQYKLQHQGEKYLVNRNKGLGEQDAEELAEALLNPDTRNIAKLVVDNKNETARLIEVLLGPSVPPRREFLLKHSEEANEND